jgi:hypothetical protein
MTDPFILFWAALILGSIAWYGFLVVYIGIRAGRDIKTLIKSLSDDHRSDRQS